MIPFATYPYKSLVPALEKPHPYLCNDHFRSNRTRQQVQRGRLDPHGRDGYLFNPGQLSESREGQPASDHGLCFFDSRRARCPRVHAGRQASGSRRSWRPKRAGGGNMYETLHASAGPLAAVRGTPLGLTGSERCIGPALTTTPQWSPSSDGEGRTMRRNPAPCLVWRPRPGGKAAGREARDGCGAEKARRTVRSLLGPFPPPARVRPSFALPTFPPASIEIHYKSLPRSHLRKPHCLRPATRQDNFLAVRAAGGG